MPIITGFNSMCMIAPIRLPRTFFACFLTAFVLLLTPLSVMAQDVIDCSTSLVDAETAYFNGDFDSTIALLQPCLESGEYTQNQGVRAHALLGRTQFVLGENDAATTAIQGLYRLDARYEPDPQLPPNFSAFILEVKQQMIADGIFPVEVPEVITPPPVVAEAIPTEETRQEKAAPRNRKALLFGGGAALAVAAGAAILLSGNSGGGGENPPPSDWPLPPARP